MKAVLEGLPLAGLIVGFWVFAIGVLAVAEVGGADFNKKCEAQVIAEWSSILTKEEWLEIVEAGLEAGTIEEPHAKELRIHVEEVYKTPGYAGRVCKTGEKV